MDGLINLYKPVGLTSAKALYRVRKVVRQRKSGHAGTLDPLAEGVLLLCLGRGTKLVERLMDLPKVYRAAARLDVTSASFDSDSPLEAVPVEAPPTEEAVRAVAAGFEGRIEQVPPAISALKIGGRPAYKLARAGREVALAARVVQVYWVHVHHYSWPELDFEVACGRGTYVRSLIRDLGAALGVGGCLTKLIRRAVGPFTAENAWMLERLEAAAGKENTEGRSVGEAIGSDPVGPLSASGALSPFVLSLEEVQRLLAEPISIPARPETA